jgi:nitrogen fixation NifU-like protein
MDPADPEVGTGLIGAPACGDVIKLQLRIQSNRIVDVRYKTFGCGSALAASGCAAELLIGLSVEEALKVTDQQIIELLDLPPIKYHCSCLTESAIAAAITDYKEKRDAHKIKPSQKHEPQAQDEPLVATQDEKQETKKQGSYTTGTCCLSASGSTTTPNTITSITKETSAPSDVMFTVTDAAIQFLKQAGQPRILLSTQSHGCMGVSYQLSDIKEDCKDYYHLNIAGMEIYVSPGSEMFVVGMTVDYEQREDWEGLVFRNPSATGKCRCGESFYL